MDKYFILIDYTGLFFGAIRIIPQMLLTIKTKNIKNIPIIFFNFQLLAGIIGECYEWLSPNTSIPHAIFFGMLILTSFIQVSFMLYLKKHTIT